MSKYRITIENIGDGANWNEDKTIECEAFAIAADKGDRTQAIIHNLSVSKLAAMFASDDEFYTTACVAKAMREAVNITKPPIAKNPLGELFASLAGDD